MTTSPELAITLSAALFDHLREEAGRLGVPIEWLVASLVVDTIDESAAELALA